MSHSTHADRLLAALAPYEQLLVLMHDNPDPDAIAAGWGVLELVKRKLGRPGRMVAGGTVVRAENRHMLRLLKPPLEFVEAVVPAEKTAVVMVDCMPSGTNHLLGTAKVSIVAVIDHHPPPAHAHFRVKFRDIRPRRIATSALVGQYLRSAGVEPSTDLATAMLYGIRTDAVGRAPMTRADHAVVSWLGQHVDFNKLAEIEQAPLSHAYFGDLLLALESAMVYGRSALCFLPRAHSTEIVGEVADLLIRGEGIDRVLCAADVDGVVPISVRTRGRGNDDASAMVAAVVEGLGFSGGHFHRAGGKLGTAERPVRLTEDLEAELRARWLRACGEKPQRGTRFVPPRTIVEHL